MTTKTLDAIFEHGVFRPLSSLDLPLTEGQQVRLVVETAEALQDALSLAISVYTGLTEEQIDELELVIFERGDFFSGRTAL